MNNSNSLALAPATAKPDKNDLPRQLTTGPVQVTKPPPTIAQLRDAMNALNIRGTCRLVSYELLSVWTPGGRVFPFVKTIAGRIGKSERVVQRQLEHLERVGVWVRCGPAPVGVKGKQPSLYEMRLPKSGGVTPTSPHGVTPTSPRSDQREVTNVHTKRTRCAVCGNSWPETYGPDCFRCLKARIGPKPRGGLPAYTERPPREYPPMSQKQTSDCEERLAADPSWRKVGGRWRKW